MNTKPCYPIFFFLFFCTPLFSQSDIYSGNTNLTQKNDKALEAFVESSEILSIAAKDYVETIEGIFEAQGIQMYGESKKDFNRRSSLYKRMIYAAPALGSTIKDKEEQSESIDYWVKEFSDEFGISYDSQAIIHEKLSAYIKAYSKCSNLYADVFGESYSGYTRKKKLPPIPPPPPPPQQHHRN